MFKQEFKSQPASTHKRCLIKGSENSNQAKIVPNKITKYDNYVDTRNFMETPISNSIKINKPSAIVEKYRKNIEREHVCVINRGKGQEVKIEKYHTKVSNKITKNNSNDYSYETSHLLSSQQKYVLDLVLNQKKNVFITGSAGTGKSYLIREIVNQLKLKEQSQSEKSNNYKSYGLIPESIAITATTGIAAYHLGGLTINSFAGIGTGDGPVGKIISQIYKRKNLRERWINTKVLIIDERVFDTLDEVAKSVRGRKEPFGGIQLIIVGDFFQLPPVSYNKDFSFCFEAKSWDKCIDEVILMHQIFRQRDPEFSELLNKLRLGQLDGALINFFKSLSRNLEFNDRIEPTELYATRNEVEQSNRQRLEKLTSESKIINCEDRVVKKRDMLDPIRDNEQYSKLLDQSTLAPRKLELKVGAQVMLIKNMPSINSSLTNGSLGIVVSFEPYNGSFMDSLLGKSKRPQIQGFNEVPVVDFGKGLKCQIGPETWTIDSNNSDIPLILSWALSIHKSQGQSLSRVKVDLGQAYVALSRAVSVNGLQVVNFSSDKVSVHKKVKDFYSKLNDVIYVG